MLDRAAIRAASRLLVDHWAAGTRLRGAAAGAVRPATRAEGYAIQAELMPPRAPRCSAGRSPRPAPPASTTSASTDRSRAGSWRRR